MNSDSKSTILITGGGGFVGRVLCKALVRSYPRSRRVQISRNAAVPIEGWETCVADVSDFDAMSQIVDSVRPDIVLHLAAQASVANSQGFAEQTWRTNLVGTIALASAVSRFTPTALFLFVSSGEVYGASLHAGCVGEEIAPKPLSPYSSSKFAAEVALQDILSLENRLIIVRPFNHTGAGQDRRFVLPSFAAQIAEVELGARAPIISVGNLEARRDFLHVNDVVDAYIGLLGAASTLSSLTVVNVCSGESVPIRSFLDEMLSMAKQEIEVLLDEDKMRPSDIPCSCGDNLLLKSLIDWSPNISRTVLCKELLDSWRG